MKNDNNGEIDIPAASAAPTINDFLTPQKVTAFSDYYVNAEYEGDDTETFDDGRLRQFFKAYVTPMGDPLQGYLEMLGRLGFRMQVSMTGEPALVVKRRNE